MSDPGPPRTVHLLHVVGVSPLQSGGVMDVADGGAVRTFHLPGLNPLVGRVPPPAQVLLPLTFLTLLTNADLCGTGHRVGASSVAADRDLYFSRMLRRLAARSLERTLTIQPVCVLWISSIQRLCYLKATSSR